MKYCYTTIAIGEKYVNAVKSLAETLLHEDTIHPIIVMTDEPEEFSKYINVKAFKFTVKNIEEVYHSKLYAIKQADKLGYKYCIFVDADITILSKEGKLEFGEEIHAIEAGEIYQAYKNRFRVDGIFLRDGVQDLIKASCDKYAVNPEGIRHIYEMFMCIPLSEAGKVDKFLECWEGISKLAFEAKFYRAEGFAIGIAAKYAGFDTFTTNNLQQFLINHKYIRKPKHRNRKSIKSRRRVL